METAGETCVPSNPIPNRSVWGATVSETRGRYSNVTAVVRRLQLKDPMQDKGKYGRQKV